MRSLLRTRLIGALLVAGLVLGASLGLAAGMAQPPAPRPPDVILRFHGSIDEATLAALGGVPARRIEHLGIVGVVTADPAAFLLAARASPRVAFAETNDPIVRAVGTGWDATGWDGTGWDGTGWDGTGWDGTGWDGTGWDGTGWDGTGWDGTGWDGTGWDGTGWDDVNFSGTGWDGTGWDGTGWDGTGWDGTGWDGTGWDGTGWDGTGWDGSLWDSSFLASRATSPRSDPLALYQWGWHTVNAKQAAHMAGALTDGSVCFVDSGVDHRHPDLAPHMWRDPATGVHGIDLVHNDNDPMDDAGHGTHVAGIAAAANRNGLGIAGAGATKIIAVKALGADGSGRELDLAAGISYCVEKGARVVSLSLSTPEDSPAVRAAVQDAAARGAILVAAAGNTGRSGEVRYPAAYPEVIAVGATMPDGRWAPYSTRAPYVDIAAPGYAIVSTYRGGGYAAINGTSMAAPFVSATVALLLQENATLAPRDVKAILGRSAIDLGPAGPDAYTGFGFLRADKAVRLAESR